MKLLIDVQSVYWTEECSRYRLAISEATLVDSLRHLDMTGVTAVCALWQCPMDPWWKRRRGMLQIPGWEVHRYNGCSKRPIGNNCVLYVSDDVALHPDSLQICREIWDRQRRRDSNGAMLWHFRHGLEIGADVQHVCLTDAPVRFECNVPAGPVAVQVDLKCDPMWAVARHNMREYEVESSDGPGVLWKSCPVNMIRRYSKTRMITGTWSGARAYWHKSKSCFRRAGYRNCRR